MFITLDYSFGQSYDDTVRQALGLALTGDYLEAYKVAGEAILIDPEDYWAYTVRGDVMKRLGDTQKAISEYSKSIDRGGGDYLKRGRLKFELHDFRGAIEDFKKAIEINPSSDKTHYEQHQVGITVDGDPHFVPERGLYQFDRPHYFKGLSYLQIGNHDKAIADFTKIIELTPLGTSDFFEEAYFYRGKAKLYLGQVQDACNDLSKAGERGFLKAYEIIRERCN